MRGVIGMVIVVRGRVGLVCTDCNTAVHVNSIINRHQIIHNIVPEASVSLAVYNPKIGFDLHS